MIYRALGVALGTGEKGPSPSHTHPSDGPDNPFLPLHTYHQPWSWWATRQTYGNLGKWRRRLGESMLIGKGGGKEGEVGR